VYSKFTTVTPKEAVIWLDTKNSHNRPISQSTVERYTQEILAGRWKSNGQAIVFSDTGQLLNGQHRLKAVVAANRSIETLIVWGVSDSAFDTIDDGNKRSLADILAIKDEYKPALLSAGVRFLWIYSTGQVATKDLRRGTIATKPLLEKTLDKHPGLRQSTKYYSMLKSRPGGMLIPAGMAIGLHYLFSLVDERSSSYPRASSTPDRWKERVFLEYYQLRHVLLYGNDLECFRSGSAVAEACLRSGHASSRNRKSSQEADEGSPMKTFSEKILERRRKIKNRRNTIISVIVVTVISLATDSYLVWHEHKRNTPNWMEGASVDGGLHEHVQFIDRDDPEVPFAATINGEHWDFVRVDHFLDGNGKQAGRTQAMTTCDKRVITYIPSDDRALLRTNIMHEIFHAGACLHGGDTWWNSEEPTGDFHPGVYHLGWFMHNFLHDNRQFAEWLAEE
jgi:hypothetical protein